MSASVDSEDGTARTKFLASSRRCAFGVVCVLGIPFCIGVFFAAKSYEGFCYGFTDGKSPCSFLQFALNQSFYVFMLVWFFVPIPFAYWGRALAVYFLSGRRMNEALHSLIQIVCALLFAVFGFWFVLGLPEILSRIFR